MRDYLLAIGVMTGNSLDAVDTVLTRISQDGSMQDLAVHSEPKPESIRREIRRLREAISQHKGQMIAAIAAIDRQQGLSFDRIQSDYVELIATAIQTLISIAKQDASLASQYDLTAIDIIGFHGQTCGHCPPSIAGSSSADAIYTIQIGDGQRLANLTGIPVVYDFRSDDMIHGGEGAPLAPMHHLHLASMLTKSGDFPIAFCNAGNTGNVSLISRARSSDALSVIGWDTGPFNNFIDALARAEKNVACDLDGKLAAQGTIHIPLLQLLFDRSVQTAAGANFLTLPPPKSSDPDWYRLLPELAGQVPVNGTVVSFVDRIRTATYFAAYAFVHSLTLIPANVELPVVFALCGGGWKNPVAEQDLKDLLAGNPRAPILPVHSDAFVDLHAKLANARVAHSRELGIDGTVMEARIFADAAVCRLQCKPFTAPSITGVQQDTVCGLIRFPGSSLENATATLREWIQHYGSLSTRSYDNSTFDPRWSRTSAGWQQRLLQRPS